MPRALIYPPRGGPPPGGPPAPGSAGTSAPSDDFSSKVLKYVPGEVVAFYVPITALAGANDHTILGVALAAGLIATPLYQLISARKISAERRARWWAYVLGMVAFAAWALATSSATAALFDLSQKLTGVILAVAALFIPALDALFTRAR